MNKLFDEIPRIENDRILLRRLQKGDIPSPNRMTSDEKVYRYLPAFLFEKQYDDSEIMIENLYGNCFTAKESLILAIEDKETGQFCGLAEFYGFKDSLHKVCVGYRLCHNFWGKGIATAVVGLMVEYLLLQTDIEIITASTMTENHASERVLEKNGFICTAHSVPEDWGYETLTAADKWFR